MALRGESVGNLLDLLRASSTTATRCGIVDENTVHVIILLFD